MQTQVLESLAGLILPESCPRCGEPSASGFCRPCRRDFVANESGCATCAEPGATPACTHRGLSWRTHRVHAPFLYTHPLDLYIHALKFAGRRKLGRSLGQLLAEAVFAHRAEIDALVTVPLHVHRLRERGYNQALEIARSVSHDLRLPILRAGITRIRATAAQTGLPAAERRRNLNDAFHVSRNLCNLRLAIVDDVITTGATVNALAGSLRRAGAVRVEAWALARTPA